MKKYSIYQRYSNILLGEYDSLKEAAKALNVSESAMYKWSSGKRQSKEFIIVRND